MRLADKVALISGGGSGIGAATARLFAREGASVVVTGRRPAPIESVAAEIGGAAVAGDASDPAHAAAAVDTAVRTFGGLDVVVANAGVGLGGSAAEVTDEQWTMTLDVNLTGPLLLIRAALPRLIDRGGGSIVVVSSVSAVVADNDSAAYAASKAGLLGLMRSVAVDYGPLGVRANAVLPGWVRTPMADGSMDELGARDGISRDAAYAAATVDTPLRRAGEPGEIAACCAFLAGDESSFVTGACLVADGGSTVVDVAGLAWDPRRWGADG
jgi:meso-butanediol dehydrogenase/(S,S)-butanediol dehydrogenase/diacetyl reductase